MGSPISNVLWCQENFRKKVDFSLADESKRLFWSKLLKSTIKGDEDQEQSDRYKKLSKRYNLYWNSAEYNYKLVHCNMS